MKDLLDIPQLLIQKGIPFAIYSLPGNEEFQLVCQNNCQISSLNILDISECVGFVIASFNSAKTGVADFIEPDFFLNEGDDISSLIKYFENFNDVSDYSFVDNYYMNKDEYLNVAEYIIEKLNGDDFDKVVLSRIIRNELKGVISIKQLLRSLAAKYKNNFVNMFHIPGVGTWFGATPETLIRMENNSLITESLAGTRLLNDDNDIPDWTDKEITEQEYVTYFVRNVLSEIGVTNYEESSLQTITSGNLAHLKTEITIPAEYMTEKTGRLIASLHPTPAVCGLPKADSFNLISRAEKHQRRYYTGFLGPWNIEGQSTLFVNLRCAELGEKYINIYVGGGLTSDSDSDSEFDETTYKSKAILSVVENL